MDQAEQLQPTFDPTHLGTGLIPHVPVPGEAQLVAFAAPDAAVEFDFSKSSGLKEPAAEDQNGSGSCTSQAFGYYFWQWASLNIVRRDGYSHTHLPGGGAYLVDPMDFANGNGVLLRDVAFNDPHPEDEKTMETVIVEAEGKRRTFQVKRRINGNLDINVLAQLVDQYKGIVIGVNGSWKPGNWDYPYTDPKFTGAVDWRHALYVYDHVIRNGEKCLVAKSSWGNVVQNHYISESFIKAGGLFESIVMEVKELNNMEKKFTFNIAGLAGVISISPEGFVSGKAAKNPGEYCELGKEMGVPTCTPKVASPNPDNGQDYDWSPFDFTK